MASKLDAEKVHAELETIREAKGGELRADDVVEAAKDNASSMHDGFEWDDTAAAHQHRKQQARQIVQSIKIVPGQSTTGEHTRAYQISPSDVSDGRSYQRIEDILRDPVKRAAMLQQALNELVTIRRRYAQLQELSIVFREIDNVLMTVKP